MRLPCCRCMLGLPAQPSKYCCWPPSAACMQLSVPALDVLTRLMDVCQPPAGASPPLSCT